MKLKFEKIRHLRIWLVCAMMSLLSMSAYAQSETVSGVVTDENGEAVAGATVKLKGTTVIVTTDIDGNYQINVTGDKPVLVFSYLGYNPVEEKVGKRRIINVALSPDAAALEEVVVVAYGQQRKISVVGAQSAMKMDDVKIPAGNLTSAIQGRLAGVVAVQRSGEPGHDDANIWIRGISTFTNQNYSPLVLVDGVERSFNNLDPEDIESFTVLKDASATAVYGVRGANGVILVTTKPGVVGKPQFTADYYEGVVTLVKKPKLADAYTYMDAANEASMNTSGKLAYTSQYIEATKKAYGLLPNDNPRMYNPYLYPAVNWMDELFQDTGHNRRLNLSVRGGVPNATYYASLSYYNETGLTRKAEMENYDGNIRYNRYNYTANINLKPTSTTKIDLGFSGYVASGNYPEQSPSTLFAAAMQINPTYLPLMMADGSIPGISSNGDFRNPYADLMCRGYRQENTSKLNSNVRLTQDFDFWGWSKGLSVSAMLAFDVTNQRNLWYKKHDDTYYYAGSKDPETGLWNEDVFDEDGNYRLNRTYQGHKELRYEQASSELKSTYFEASINYNRSFGLNRVGALFVYNQKNYSQTAGDLVGSLPYKQQGIAGRATYSWDDRYFAEFNIGYNGSENFSPKKRFGCFPAFGIGWAISNEKFWEPIATFVPFFKIRYTDGKVGTDAVTNRRFMYLDQMAAQDGYYFGVNNSLNGGWGFSKYGANVGWSTSHKRDLGVDIRLLRNDLQLTVDLFHERREGIFLQRATIPDYAGFIEMPYGNLGIVENKGIDATLEYTTRFNKDIWLTVRGNFSYNEDKIIENDDPTQPYPWLEKRGTNVNGRWGWIAEGLFTSEEEIMDHAKQFGEEYPGQVSRPGDVKYKDLNGDGMIDDYDKCLIGQGDVPKIYYGFGFNLQIKNFSLGTLFSGTAMADRCLSGNAIQPFCDTGGIANLYSNIGDRWSADDPTNTNVFYPRLRYGATANANNNKTSTWWQKDVSFLRLKQLTLSYNLPNKWLSKIFIKSARIYATGTNLFTISKFKLWDPELNTNNGISYPNNRTYSLGINVSF